ncbi:hypothetical protein NC652_013737 [Populus alba x Populus x berolinensis]|nr:hypothetical protein NC652_013737 [Populus alba x Populus x berolinensis]
MAKSSLILPLTDARRGYEFLRFVTMVLWTEETRWRCLKLSYKNGKATELNKSLNPDGKEIVVVRSSFDLSKKQCHPLQNIIRLFPSSPRGRTIKATGAVFGSKHGFITSLTGKQPLVIICEELFKNDNLTLLLSSSSSVMEMHAPTILERISSSARVG